MSDRTEYNSLSLTANLASFDLQMSTVFFMYLVFVNGCFQHYVFIIGFCTCGNIGSFDTKKSKRGAGL
jgi:hypothetical protein